MNKNLTLGLGATLLAGAAGWAGNWWGTHQAAAPMASPQNVAAPATTTPDAAAPKARKLLFYRNPMGLADTSPTPKKDSMGMDYIAVYAGEEDDTAQTTLSVKISAEKIQKLGVRTEAAALRVLDKTVRAVGRIEPDERRIATIAPKFEGYVERLLVNATGQSVAKGQALLEAYSPELLAAQREYAIAAQGVQALGQAGREAQNSMQQLADASLARLRNWDVSDEQIKDLAATGTARRTLTLRSSVAGVVSEKKAVQGMRFMPGEVLYQVTDLSAVWLLADVAEQDIGALRLGARARVQINAYPDKNYAAALSYIYPSLNAETRTVPVRLELANPGGLLKPGMFAQVELPTGSAAKVLTVPVSAVIDSGQRQMVLLQNGDASSGRFEPRSVTLGARSDNYLQVLDGLKAGDQVVTSANFLIDAESNLKAAIAGFGAAAAAGSAPSGSMDSSTSTASSAAGHQAEGRVLELDAKSQSVTISHGPVASLKWPGMTMDFALANRALQKDLKPGASIRFEFVERGKGEWVITKVTPMPAASPQTVK